ncbi:MAG: HAD-IB family hydrolase [Propionibacteriales bacterium]|nr:HAD-IB family hydrolase [Propionibacteriales bacterium]
MHSAGDGRPDDVSGPLEAPEALPDGHGAAAAVAHPPAVNVAAFFDVANTMVRGASAFLLAKGLHARGFFDTVMIVRGMWWHAWYRIAGKERANHMEGAREGMLSMIRGARVDEIADAADEIYDELISQRLWPGTVALAAEHIAAGHQVWLVTAAPVEVATLMAQRLGLTGALGTRAEHIDGAYTGRLLGDMLHGPAKAEAIAALAAERHLDLTASHAYSDSSNDLPMLDLVGHPNVVNPDRKLRRRARSTSWPIREFRTGRRAALLGASSVLGAGALLGTLSAVATVLRRRRA